jgi:hypothetical protein
MDAFSGSIFVPFFDFVLTGFERRAFNKIDVAAFPCVSQVFASDQHIHGPFAEIKVENANITGFGAKTL